MTSRKFLIALGSIGVVLIFGLSVIAFLPESEIAWGYLQALSQTVFSIVVPGYMVTNVGANFVEKKNGTK